MKIKEVCVMAGFNFNGGLVKAVKGFLGKTLSGDDLKNKTGEELYVKVNNEVVAMKEYAPMFKKLSVLTGVPERVLYAVAIARGSKDINEDVMRLYATSIADAYLKANSWGEAINLVAQEGGLPPSTERVYEAIDEKFIRTRTPMEKAKLYLDRVEDSEPSIRDLLKSKGSFYFHTIIIEPSGGVKGVKNYHALTFKKYKEPKDNGEVASFFLSMTPDDDWEGFKHGFYMDDADSLIGSFKIEDGHVIVQANGREMPYSKAKEVFPSLSLVVEVAMQRAKELGRVVDVERKKKRDRDMSSFPSRRAGINPPGL